MRNILIGCIAALIFAVFGTQADARRGVGGQAQGLIFVSTTEIPGDDGPLALCHLVDTASIMFVNVWRSLQSYALAENNCDTSSYYEMTAADVTEAKSVGAIPASVPDMPKLSMSAMAEGFWGFGALAALLAFAGGKLAMVKKRTGQRRAMMSGATPAAQAILDAMCHAAKADGYIAPCEVKMIKGAAEDLTGQTFDLADVKRMVELAEETLNEAGFKRLVAGRTKHEMLDMMRGVLMVAAADGRLDGKEKIFVGQLAQAMKMDGDTVGMLLQDVASTGAGQPVPA